MPDRSWKREERCAAALFGGRRFPANTGGLADFETAAILGQVKHVRRLSLVTLEALALEMERIGTQKNPPKCGLVIVKRRAGQGRGTPRLVVCTEGVWRAMKRDAEYETLFRSADEWCRASARLAARGGRWAPTPPEGRR